MVAILQCQSIRFLGNASSSQGVFPIAIRAGLDIQGPKLSNWLCPAGPQCWRGLCPGPVPCSGQSLGIPDGADSVLYESLQRAHPWWVYGHILPARPPTTPATGPGRWLGETAAATISLLSASTTSCALQQCWKPSWRAGMMRISGSAKLFLLWGSGLKAATTTLPRLQDRGHLVSPQVQPELGILCCNQSLRLPLQRLHLRGQPRLPLLHAPNAHGLAFAGVGAHFGAVRHQSGQRHQAQIPRQLHQHRPEIRAVPPPKFKKGGMLGLIPCRQHPEGHILYKFLCQASGRQYPRGIAMDQNLHPHSGRIRQIP